MESEISHEIQPALHNGVALCEDNGGITVFVECERAVNKHSEAFFEDIRREIHKLLINSIGIKGERIVFLTTFALPRTSSGKIQRTRLIELLGDDQLSILNAEEEKEEVGFNVEEFDWSEDAIENYLEDLLSKKLKINSVSELYNNTFFELGMSSIIGVELVNQMRNNLRLEVELEQLYRLNNIVKVKEYLVSLKWLNSVQIEGDEIEL